MYYVCVNTAILDTDFDYKIDELSILEKGQAVLFTALKRKRHFCTFVHLLLAPETFVF